MGLKERKGQAKKSFWFWDCFRLVGSWLKRIVIPQWLGKLKIGVKLTLGFIIVALIAGMIGLVGTLNINRISRDSYAVYTRDIAVLDPMYKISTKLLQLQNNTFSYVLDPNNRERYKRQIMSLQKQIDLELADLKKKDTTVIDQLNNLERTIANYWDEETILLKLGAENKVTEAIGQISQKLNPLANMVDSIIKSLFTTSNIEAKMKTEANFTTARQTTLFMVALAVIGILAALGLGTVISYSISRPMKRLAVAAEQLAVGDVNVAVTTVNARNEVAVLTNGFAKMADSIREQAAAVAKIAAGDLDVDIKVKSEQDLLAKSLLVEITTLKALTAETGKLTAAASRGQLDVRGDAKRFSGEYQCLISGFNQTLDAVTAPLSEAGTVLGKMAVNDYTVAMEGNYQGLLKDFAGRINRVQQHLLEVQDLFCRVAQGDISRLEEYRAQGKQSENDQLVPAAVTMMEALQNLIAETEIIANAAARGQLTVRSDAAKLTGKYQEIVVGINDALDQMAQPIGEALTVLEEMAQGNLDRTMDGIYQGDYARLQEGVNGTVRAFNLILGEINGGAEQVAAASRELSKGSEAVSRGATTQAATIEELSASVAAIADRIKQNAVQANQTVNLAETTKQSASHGNDQVQLMLAAMRQISDAAQGISKIIKVIEEIAFQTNILALNAAIEAARAGVAGKGFAVVAEEVRNLAGRSAAAAKETAELIEGSIEKTVDGMRIANQTAEALDQMVVAVTKAVALVNEIATASNDQATGITQINQGISQVALVTQSATATSEESAAASEELLGQAENLRQLVGRFRLKRQ
jgi:methyl-accepting chemotaxis protein